MNNTEQQLPHTSSTFIRVARYTAIRVVVMFATIFASLFLIIYIANLGGYLDTIQRGLISENINNMLFSGWLRHTPEPERTNTIAQTTWRMEERAGLHQPYLLRTFDWLRRGLTFDWGKSSGGNVTMDIKVIILAFLPRTLLLLGVSNLGLFACSILIALPLTRRPGGWIDRTMMALTPLSSAPSWFYALILYGFLYKYLGVYSIGLGLQEWPAALNLQSVLTVLRALALPFAAIVISKLFQSIYAWRTYFLAYAREDYLELAKAKGLPDGLIERRYLLKPALPAILTSFALIVVSVWQECIAVEYFFNINGVGMLFVLGLDTSNIPIIVALVATFAYFLAITVFILDIVYALVDPRVKIGENRLSTRPKRQRGPHSAVIQPRNERKRSTAALESHWALQPTNPPAQVKKAPALSIKTIQQVLARCVADTGRFFRQAWQVLRRSPSSLLALATIAVLVFISIFTMIQYPYARAVKIWEGDLRSFYRNPVQVPPAWFNWFRQDKLPENIVLSSKTHPEYKTVTETEGGIRSVTFTLPFDYPYSTPPQDVLVLFTTQLTPKQPFVRLVWMTPDGRKITLKNSVVSSEASYLVSKDIVLASKLKTQSAVDGLFLDNKKSQVITGPYRLSVEGILFEPDSDLDVELVIQGKVYGWAGTDLYRKDLTLALGWGTAIALFFGITAALSTTFLSVILAAMSAWFGGWIDGLIQRITEINMVLPVLPTAIMIFFLYSKSFWAILGITVALSIFGNSLKNYRAMFLQVIQLPYIEAARAYGAPAWRIIIHYLVPRIQTVLIPQLIILIPGYIFFEATLAFLGVSDPYLPTLGKLLKVTMGTGIFNRPLYLTVEPVVILFMIGISFTLLGFALERSLNERLGG